MQITIKPSLLRSVAAAYVDQAIYDNYDKADQRAVKVPSRSELINGLLNNEKFMRGVERYLSDYINDVYVIDDAFCSGDMYPSPLKKYVDTLDKLRANKVDKNTVSASMSK